MKLKTRMMLHYNSHIRTYVWAHVTAYFSADQSTFKSNFSGFTFYIKEHFSVTKYSVCNFQSCSTNQTSCHAD